MSSDKVQKALRSMRSKDGCLTEKPEAAMSDTVAAAPPPFVKRENPWHDDPYRMPRSETLVNPFCEKIPVVPYCASVMIGNCVSGKILPFGAWVKIRSEGYNPADTGSIIVTSITGTGVGPWDTRSIGTFLIRDHVIFPFYIGIRIDNQHGFCGRGSFDFGISLVVEVGEPMW